MKLSVLIFREIALRVKQIDKAEDEQNHGKQRGQKDSMQLAVALKDQLLLFRVLPALFFADSWDHLA